jgi:hypothetical protein
MCGSGYAQNYASPSIGKEAKSPRKAEEDGLMMEGRNDVRFDARSDTQEPPEREKHMQTGRLPMGYEYVN